MSATMTDGEILDDFNAKYARVRKLLDEESKFDPVQSPYRSKYIAKEMLLEMREFIKKLYASNTLIPKCMIDAMLSTVLLNIGIINVQTDELLAGERVLIEAFDILTPIATRPEIVIISLDVCNNLGLVWTARDNPLRAKQYLLQAIQFYVAFKSSFEIKMPINPTTSVAKLKEDIFDYIVFEKTYTLSLYYLAQVYRRLNEKFKSSILCHLTLKRQMMFNDYEPIDWALNAATLAQVFAEQNGFFQARYLLSGASKVLEQYEEKLLKMGNDTEDKRAELEKLRYRSADVARCWAMYCIILMKSSKARLMNDDEETADAITDLSNLTIEDDENVLDGDIKNLIVPDLDVSTYENKIGDKFLLTYQDARAVFLCCQSWIDKACEYYTLDTLASEYVELVQSRSLAYSLLAFFEEDVDRQAKMLKRRIDMLEKVVKEINPLYYLQYCRQIWDELGSTYSEILHIKLDKLEETDAELSPHAERKINKLCEKVIKNYEHFVQSFKNKNGEMPEKVDHDFIRPVVTACIYIAKYSTKRIATDRDVQLSHYMKSYDSYKAAVAVCTRDKAAADMMPEEFSLCKEMVCNLSKKIKQLGGNVASEKDLE